MKDLSIVWFHEVGNAFKGKVNVGLFYSINYPKDYFEKSIRPHLKQSEEVLKMLNGKVSIYTAGNISKNERSKTSPDAQKKIAQKEKEFEKDLEEVFKIGAELSSDN